MMEDQALGQSVSRPKDTKDFRHDGSAISTFVLDAQGQPEGYRIHLEEIKNAVIESICNSGHLSISPDVVEQVRANRVVDDIRHVGKDPGGARGFAQCVYLIIFLCG